jgi:hypothetical protein
VRISGGVRIVVDVAPEVDAALDAPAGEDMDTPTKRGCMNTGVGYDARQLRFCGPLNKSTDRRLCGKTLGLMTDP